MVLVKMKHLIKILLIISLNFLVGCELFQEPQSSPTIQRPIPAPNPQNITLLLPLRGELANESQAIYNGFLAAYDYDKQLNQTQINIKVTDISSGNIQEIYQQTAAENPAIIIGPLTKPTVAALADNPITIPTITLNTLDNYQTKIVPNLYQFGLAPQDEAQQVADKIWLDQHARVAIIAPANNWGQTITQAFRLQYIRKSGQIIVRIEYTNQDDFDQVVKTVLDIVRTKITDPTHKTTKIKWETAYRQDVDAIFLIAQPTIARQIMPLLKFYAADIPVYTISSVYSGNPDQVLDQDLNGIFFCDMPWVIKNSVSLSPQLQAIRNQIITLWPDFANYTKFYALGIDAYLLATSLHKLIANPQTTIDGATGTLQLDRYNHIYRTLDWARMQQGSPIAN